MCLWFPGLKWSLLFQITKAGKVSKYVTSFTLQLLGRALKAFHMNWISTLWTPPFVLVGTLDIKPFLVLPWQLGILTTMILVVWLSGLDRGLLFLVSSCWKFCALVPQKVDLHHLWVTSYLFNMVCSGLGAFHFFLQTVLLCLLGTCLNPYSHH